VSRGGKQEVKGKGKANKETRRRKQNKESERQVLKV
jgi:hypothetical protein